MTAAPLIATAEAPIPTGARAFWFDGVGKVKLRAAVVPAAGPARGSVILSLGRTEPIEKYFEVAQDLAARGLFVLIHDWRGQGLSQRLLDDRMKGHADGHGAFLDDLTLLLDAVEAELPKPWIGMGHSMGGALTAMAVAEGETRFSALFLSAPMMGVAAVRQLPQAAHFIAQTMMGIGHSGDYILKDAYDPMHGPFEGNILTHDPVRYERYRGQLRACPDLALGGVTWGWLAFSLDCAVHLARPSAAKAAGMPVTVAAAGDDHLVLNGPARKYAERAPQGRYVEIAGAYHEVMMETDARLALVWKEFDALVERAGL